MLNLLLSISLLASVSDEFRRVQAHLKLGDHANSVAEARAVFDNHPSLPGSYEILVLALAASGDHDEMLKVWDQFATRFPKQAYEQRILEAMCWGVLRRGKETQAMSTRLISTIGATLTQDAYALDFLIHSMRDSNITLRALSVELASLLGDRVLKDELIALLKREKKLEVRLEILKAIKKLKLTETYDELLKIIDGRHASAEERALAIAAVLEMSQGVDQKQLHRLSVERRAAFRKLAVELIAKFELRDETDLLVRLTQDPNVEVAAAALHTMGLLRLTQINGGPITDYFASLTISQEPLIGITASWALLLHDRKEGTEAFRTWIFHEQEDIRAMAAAAISSAGPYGVRTALKYLDMTTDPYVQINLSRVLVGQRVNCAQACQIMDGIVRGHAEQLMELESGFHPIVRSRLTHKPGIPNYPEIVNQKIRLEMLNLLAILEHPEATDAIRAFLKTRPYGLTGLAAEMYLGEGDELAFDHVRELLNDPDKQVRAEAALVLATWARDASVLPILIDLYPGADRNLKIKLLEALGRVGNRETIPFLVERLKEPSLNFRLIAASVLLQCLNH